MEIAVDRTLRALAALGQVRARNQHGAEGTVTFGLQRVRVRITWTPDPQGTRLILQASGDDIWGTAAKSALERLESAIRNIDVPGYQVDRRGMHPGALV